LVLAWMIPAHESRTVASYRKNSSTEPGLDFEVVHEGDSDAFAVRNRPPDLKGIVTCTTRLSF
jgi:hypothetical protein